MGGIEDLKKCLQFCAINKIFPSVENFSFDEFSTAVHRVHYEKHKNRCVIKCISHSFPIFNY